MAGKSHGRPRSRQVQPMASPDIAKTIPQTAEAMASVAHVQPILWAAQHIACPDHRQLSP
jgi:hypothetical protein